MQPKAVVAHGGGPTAVINASLAGLTEQCRETGRQLYGAHYGLAGLLRGEFIELTAVDPERMRQVGEAPGSAIGSSRLALDDDDYGRLLDVLRRTEVRTFFYTGGNGSMETALRVSRRARDSGYELQVIGIPKTIDNDLCVTDHTPGYASTARFFAYAARAVEADNRSLPPPVCVLETLGRNAGWIVAATSLARRCEKDGPHLIYLPEKRVSLDAIASDVERVYQRLGRVVIAVCEGQLDERGLPFGADVDRADSGVHRLASNLGHTLARLLSAKLGIRARAEKPGLMGRCCGEFVPAVDRKEAFACGRAAGQAADDAQTEVMVALRRESNEPYRSTTFLTPLESVARVERLLPAEWIDPGGCDVLPGFREWAAPLVGEVPGLASLVS